MDDVESTILEVDARGCSFRTAWKDGIVTLEVVVFVAGIVDVNRVLLLAASRRFAIADEPPYLVGPL